MTATVISHIASWTTEQRQEALSELLKLSVGPISIGDSLSALVFSSAQGQGAISSNCSAALLATPWIRFLPKKLIILEKSQEYREIKKTVEHEEVMVHTAAMGREYKRTVRTIAETPYTEIRTVPRSSWEIVNLFVGAKIIFGGGRGVLAGELFGPDSQVEFLPEVCEPGIAISLVLVNRSEEALWFDAVLLGQVLGPGQSTTDTAEPIKPVSRFASLDLAEQVEE